MKKKTQRWTWFSDRFPLDGLIKQYFTQYYLPSNLNFWYIFGSLALFLLFLQLVSGIWLTMFYIPTTDAAFNSIETMMREVPYGWLFRYMHSTGASCFFIVIYAHIFRSLLYGSYKKPRELVWLIGMGLYVLLLVEAFMGYALPWGQMSYWGSQVITSLLASVPIIGADLMLWIRGNVIVSDELLHRFFALHIIALPLFLILFVLFHLAALRKVGTNNPDADSALLNNKSLTQLPFHPYYTIKHLFSLVIFLVIFFAIVFFSPTMGGYFLDLNNFTPANTLATPEHIAPLWYLAPFYSMLCILPSKLLSIVIIVSSIAIVFFLPWLDQSPIKSIRFRSTYFRVSLGVFVITLVLLGYLGMTALTSCKIRFMQILTLNYFMFFILMPFYTNYERKFLGNPVFTCGK
jgi:ubiquinol-cytochrome c reductase cytochrome b subunit